MQDSTDHLLLVVLACMWIGVAVIRWSRAHLLRAEPGYRAVWLRRYRMLERFSLVALIVWTVIVALPPYPFFTLSVIQWATLLGMWVAARMLRQYTEE